MVLDPDFLVRGIKEISLLPYDEVQQVIPWLTEIAVSLQKEWTFEDLLNVTGQANLIAWLQRVQRLQAHGLVENAGGNRYKIVDGVREFFQAANIYNQTIFDKVSVRTDIDLGQFPWSSSQSQNIVKQIADAVQAAPEEIRRFDIEKVWVTLEMPVGLADLLTESVRQNQKAPEGMQIITILPKNLDTLIRYHFDVNELQHLVYQMNIEYQDLTGETKHAKILALIDHCKRHGRLEQLIYLCRLMRPHINW